MGGEGQASSAVTNDSEPDAAAPAEENVPDKRAAPDPVDDLQARRAITSAVVMLAAILICGVGLIAMVLLWGNRARRIARQTLPKVAPRDELWYLKRGASRPPDDRDELEETFPGPKP